MNNHSLWLKTIRPDAMHNVGVRTPELLVIAFHNVYFFLSLFPPLVTWEIIQVEVITGCVPS